MMYANSVLYQDFEKAKEILPFLEEDFMPERVAALHNLIQKEGPGS